MKTKMINTHPRLVRERKTIAAMAHLYCQKTHHSPKNTLCPDCQAMVHYASERLARCPFQENKPTCAKCTVHCYKPVMREKVRQMMRRAGPLMLFQHPLLTFFHLVIDGHRKPPILERKSSS